MTVFGGGITGWRVSRWPQLTRVGRHTDLWIPLPFGRTLWLYYSRDP